MKCLRLVFTLVFVCVILAGCDIVDNIRNAQKEFEIPEYNLKISADIDFEKVDASNLDLQITDGSCYLSVMAYKSVDLAEGQSTKDVYDFHNSDLFSKRDNVSVIEDESTETLSGKSIVKTCYSAENNGVKNYYYSYLVDFGGDGAFAWVLATGVPSYMESNAERLDNIVKTLEFIK